jgi:hypothetical protein
MRRFPTTDQILNQSSSTILIFFSMAMEHFDENIGMLAIIVYDLNKMNKFQLSVFQTSICWPFLVTVVYLILSRRDILALIKRRSIKQF